MTTAHGPAERVTESSASTGFDVNRIRRDFPALHQKVNGQDLVYLDNAATTQKPNSVIEAVRAFYVRDNANIHRGVHALSLRATSAYEETRARFQRALNAAESREILFVRGTTEGINLVAQTHGRLRVKEGDEVLVSTMEHHSNIVPWQILCEQTGARLRAIPINDAGELLMDEYEKMLSSRTRVVAVVHVSNSLGTVNPIQRIVKMAHGVGATTVVDGAQALPHLKVDVRDLDCDFYAISGHKMFGPTGVGVLYGKAKLLEEMPPYQGGGDMIASVSFDRTLYNRLPYKFEAGTPHIAGGIGLGAALDYLERIGYPALAQHESEVVAYATQKLMRIPRIKLVGTAREKLGVVSFTIEGIHPHDVGTVLDQEGIAVRAGHHCTQPLMERFGVPATVRASFAFYNTKQEVDALVTGVQKVLELLG